MFLILASICQKIDPSWLTSTCLQHFFNLDPLSPIFHFQIIWKQITDITSLYLSLVSLKDKQYLKITTTPLLHLNL